MAVSSYYGRGRGNRQKGRFRTKTTDVAPLAAGPSAFVLKMSRTWPLFCIAFSQDAVLCPIHGTGTRLAFRTASLTPGIAAYQFIYDSSAHNVLPLLVRVARCLRPRTVRWKTENRDTEACRDRSAVSLSSIRLFSVGASRNEDERVSPFC